MDSILENTLRVIERNDQRLRLIEEGNIDENSTQAEQPADIETRLYPHQLSALHRMKQCEQQGGIIGEDGAMYFTRLGVYGDLVGSGKSLTVLALAASESVVTSITHEKKAVGTDYYVETPISPGPKELKATVVVVPHHLLNQWKMYAERDLPVRTKWQVIARIQDVDGVLADINDVDVIICDCTFFNAAAKKLKDVHAIVNRVCFDEADTLRIPACAHMNSKFTWFVTASVSNLVLPSSFQATSCEGDVETITLDCYHRGLKHRGYIAHKAKDLFMLVQDISPFLVINNPAFIRSSLRLPQAARIDHRCTEPQLVSLLRGIVPEVNMQALYANDVRSAMGLRDGGCIVAKEDLFDNLQKGIEQELNNERHFLAFNENYRGRPANVQDKIVSDGKQKIDELERKLKTLKDRLDSTSVQCCPICLDEMHTPMCVLKCCNTMFCLACWSKLSNTDCNGYYKCPNCRSFMPQHMIISDKVEKVQSKSDIVVNIIKNKAEGSFIIFNERDLSLSKLSATLFMEGISHSTLDRNSRRSLRVCDDFQEGKIRVLLLNAQQMATGLNLTRASDVIITHRMSKEMETQAIGRCMRVGRTSKLSVHHILYDSENTE